MLNSEKYKFYGRLSQNFPSQVIIDLTEVCNLACVHCPHPDFIKSKHYNARMLDGKLNSKIVDEIKKFGKGITQYIRYSSEGEPLINNKSYDLINYAIMNSGVFVTLTTNGTVINEKKIKTLLSNGLHMIDISIDAFNEDTYKKIRVNGDLKKTRLNVLNLLKWNKEFGGKTKIIVSFVKQSANIAEVKEFESFWYNNGADFVVIRDLHSAAGEVKSNAELLWHQVEKKERRPCVYPWERIILNPRGFLSFCPADWSHKSSIIDYRFTTVKEIWNGKFYTDLRNAHLDNNFECHKFCGQCPDWQNTKWPQQGRSYADLIEEFKD